MATVLRNFADEPLGSAASVSGAASAAIVDHGGTNVLQLTGQGVVSFNEIIAGGEVEVRGMVRLESAGDGGSTYLGPAMRGGPWYVAVLYREDEWRSLAVTSGGVSDGQFENSGIGYYDFNIHEGHWINFRFHSTGDGGTYRFKAWLDGSTEPAEWDNVRTFGTASGDGIGLMARPDGALVQYAWVGIGTNGDPAPTVEGGPVDPPGEAGEIEEVIVDADGIPVSGATVYAINMGNFALSKSGVTNGSGVAEITDLQEGVDHLVVARGGNGYTTQAKVKTAS